MEGWEDGRCRLQDARGDKGRGTGDGIGSETEVVIHIQIGFRQLKIDGQEQIQNSAEPELLRIEDVDP